MGAPEKHYEGPKEKHPSEGKLSAGFGRGQAAQRENWWGTELLTK